MNNTVNQEVNQDRCKNEQFSNTPGNVIGPDVGFTIISTSAAQDPRLSDAGRCLLLVCHTLPSDWKIHPSHLGKRLGWGRDKTRATFNELAALGYAENKIARTQDGRFEGRDIKILAESPTAPKIGTLLSKDLDAKAFKAERNEAVNRYLSKGKDVAQIEKIPEPENPAPENPAPENHPPTKKRSKQSKDSNKNIMSENDVSDGVSESRNSNIKEVIEYFNKVTGQKLKHTSNSHRKHISGRLSDGHSVAELNLVVDFKLSEVQRGKFQAQYIRPSTLFCDKNFGGYLFAAKQWNGANQEVKPTSYDHDTGSYSGWGNKPGGYDN